MTETTRQKYMDAMSRRADLIQQAEAAFDGGSIENGIKLTDDAKALNAEIAGYQTLMAEEARFADGHPAPTDHEDAERAAETMHTFLNGGTITFSAEEVRNAFGVKNSTTLATGSIVAPSRVGMLHDNLSAPCSILDQVFVQDLTGCSAVTEPIVWAEQEAQAGTIASQAGTARTASDPTFKNAKLQPYELNVTSFVDRNLSRLSPVAYEEKVRSLALQALRRKCASLIFNGDGQASPQMYGIKNAKTTDNTALFKTVPVSAISAGFLDDLVFAVGSDEETMGSCRLWLTKADLKAIGKLRNSDDQRIYEVVSDAANPNIGRIVDGGLIIPYCISSALTALSTATQGTAAIQHMVYGDPMQYEMGLFGSYSIRIDESVKSIERMNAILGDVTVGGNVIGKDAFAIGTLPAKA